MLVRVARTCLCVGVCVWCVHNYVCVWGMYVCACRGQLQSGHVYLKRSSQLADDPIYIYS